jgi:23S rRNA pseudouridine2605 synthase
MHEGRNRQIRRTFTALGYTVRSLDRTQFGPYTLGDVPPGNIEVV